MIVLPNLDWYLSIGAHQQLSPRCPYASVYRCPRFYQSLSLLGNAGSTKIDPKEDDRLKESWERTAVWPVTAEQATTISGPGEEIKHFSHFCPEVSYERFGLFATELHRYADEIDIGVAHRQLSADKVSVDDWRWNWSLIEPMHFVGCPLYSLLESGKGINGLKPSLTDGEPIEAINTSQSSIAQIIGKYQGQRIKANNDAQLEQFFVHNGKLHYIDIGAAQVCDRYGIVPQHVDVKDEFIFSEEDSKGGGYNAAQMEDILIKLGVAVREHAVSFSGERTPDNPFQVILHFLWPPDTLKKKALLVTTFLILACFAIWGTLPDKTKTDMIDLLRDRIVKTNEGDNSKPQKAIPLDNVQHGNRGTNIAQDEHNKQQRENKTSEQPKADSVNHPSMQIYGENTSVDSSKRRSEIAFKYHGILENSGTVPIRFEGLFVKFGTEGGNSWTLSLQNSFYLKPNEIYPIEYSLPWWRVDEIRKGSTNAKYRIYIIARFQDERGKTVERNRWIGSFENSSPSPVINGGNILY